MKDGKNAVHPVCAAWLVSVAPSGFSWVGQKTIWNYLGINPMPTVRERLVHIASKITRAKKHIGELQNAQINFSNSHPYQVGTKYQAGTRKLVYYVSKVAPVPTDLSLIFGDVIQCLMTSLDHLAYQIVCSDTGDNPPEPKRIYFPIFEDVASYNTGRKRKLVGASEDSIDAIDAIRPFKGGNDLLWMLHQLNNIEKHRLLLTVGGCAAGVSLGSPSPNMLASAPPELHDDMNDFYSSIFVMPADKGFPLKEGFELLIAGVDEKPNPNQKFRFNIVLNEPGIAEGKWLIETVQQLANAVESVITILTSRLKDTP